ncbi:cell adhesion molecule CEACAM6-like [Alosa pseudoharengus]|uniref:cell adhesion molecule CEACAM6-like n=1 Tax=Alosa pseudoharengus TaxID=34774 RepID=UPI003F8CB38E
MEYLLYKTAAFLLLGLCLCQNDLQVDAPPYGEAGQSVEFTITNPPPPPFFIVTWRLKGGNIVVNFNGAEEVPTDGYIGRVSVSNTTGSLELRQLTDNDTGIYTVSIQSGSNTWEGEKSLTHVFERITTSPITSTGGTLIAGSSSVNLTCDAQGTFITREWTKDGTPLSPSNRITFYEDNRTLSISPVEKEDSGQYTCTVSNPVSSVSENHNLVVNYGPVSVQISPVPEVTTGDRVSLDCSADSVPTASFAWMFNKTEVGDKSQLVIEKVDQIHAGIYTCTAWNSVTGHNASAEHMLRVIDETPSSGLSDGAIAGIAIGTIAGVALVGGSVAFGTKKAGVW